MLENEIKLTLTKKQYLEIKDTFFTDTNFGKKIQINYYYDNDNSDLFNNSITLRIRQIENNLTRVLIM